MTRHKPTSSTAAAPIEYPDSLGLERLIFFSDAVFAIAITLLALEIRLPAHADVLTDDQLLALVAGIWPRYLAYFLSFMVVGVFWTSHHRKFRLIRRYDGRLLTLNLLVLMVIAFIPFPSSLISEFTSRIAVIAYDLVMILADLLMGALWWYASSHNWLTDPHLNEKQRRQEFIRPIASGAVFLLSIGIAFMDPTLAMFTWLLLFPVSFFNSRNS